MRSSEDLLSIAESPTRSSTAYTPTIHGRAAAAVFYDLNGFDLDPPSVDEAVDLVVAVAAGHLDLSALQVKPQAACG